MLAFLPGENRQHRKGILTKPVISPRFDFSGHFLRAARKLASELFFATVAAKEFPAEEGELHAPSEIVFNYVGTQRSPKPRTVIPSIAAPLACLRVSVPTYMDISWKDDSIDGVDAELKLLFLWDVQGKKHKVPDD